MSERPKPMVDEARIEELVRALTLEEKVALATGVDMWHTAAIPRLGIPALKLSDGPHGARGERFAEGPTSLSMPCGSAMGATFDVSLLEEIGAALADETRSKGAHVLLGPTVNLHRDPRAGRNFECHSEDPELSARLAVAFITGLQRAGVGACIKHFVCNDSEWQRHTISSEVDERALRELYLRPFERAVREAKPWSLMSAYNRVNGSWCSENEPLLRDLLKGEWQFDGAVISDWFGTNSTVPAANAGLDLEMPGPGQHFGPKLLDAVKRGEVAEQVIDDKARRLLRLALRTGAFDAPVTAERAIDRPEHRALARRTARQAIVLLKNEGDLLPLDVARLASLAVIGPNAHPGVSQGGGSSRVSPHYVVSPLAGIRERVGDRVRLRVEAGCTRHRRLPILDADWCEAMDGDADQPIRIDYFDGFEPTGTPVKTHRARRMEWSWFGPATYGLDRKRFSARVSARLRVREDGLHTLSVASAGLARVLVDGELVIDNWTRWERGDLFYGMGSTEVTGTVDLRAGRGCLVEVEYSKQGSPVAGGIRVGILPPMPDDAMERAVEAARESDAAIVVVGLDADWETEGSDRVNLELPGRQAELVARVAAVNPRTVVVLEAGGPLDVESFVDRVPALMYGAYLGQEAGRALADLVFGDVSPSGRLPTTWPRRLADVPGQLGYPGEFGHVTYAESVFMGYRWYDAREIEPRFAFGHGLGYGAFTFAQLGLDRAHLRRGEVLRGRLELSNTGPCRAAEVVQIYLRDVASSALRPPKELVAFVRVELDAGESRSVEFEIPPAAFTFRDPVQHAFVAEPGRFEVLVGASSRDIRLRADVELVDGESAASDAEAVFRE